MNRLDEHGYAGLYKALKHKYNYALSTNLPCVSRHSQFLALLCIFPELISLQESCGSRFCLISRLLGCLKCLLLLIVRHIPEIRNDKWPPFVDCESCQTFLQKYEILWCNIVRHIFEISDDHPLTAILEPRARDIWWTSDFAKLSFSRV